MLTIQTNIIPGGVEHIVECFNAQLASEVLEVALRSDFYVEIDENDARRVTVFFAQDVELDALLTEARNAYDQSPMLLAA